MEEVNSGAPVDSQMVQQQLRAVREDLERWAKECSAEDRSMDQWFSDFQLVAPGAVRRIQEEEAAAREKAARDTAEAMRQHQELAQLAGRLKESQELEAETAASLAEFEKSLSALQASLATKRAEVANEGALREQTTQQLLKAAAKYQQYLGLNLEPTGGDSLRVSFTQIDPLEPDREFHFVFHSDPTSKVYKVTECQPRIAKLDELVEELNASNKIAAFFKAFRVEFQRIVTAGQ